MFNELIANNNPIINSTISLMLTGAALYLLKELPIRLWYIIVEQFTTTVNISNYNISYYHLLQYFRKHNVTKYSRILAVVNGKWGEDDEAKLAPGQNGTHYIHMLNKFMKIQVSRVNGNSERDKEDLFITYLGRNHQYVHDILNIIKEESEKERDPSKMKIYKWHDRWYDSGTEYKRDLDSVIVDDSIKNDIINHIDDFIGNKDIYKKIGKPYRTSIMLHGKPGTGKTSLIKAIASEYDKDLCIINASNITDIEVALSSLQKNSFVVIEDMDSLKGTTSRKKDKDDFFTKTESQNTSALLNALDGIGSYTDSILFMTTNHLSKLDPALLRKGRCDLIIEIKEPSLETLKKITTDKKELNKMKNMKGCDLQDYLLQREINGKN